MISEARQMLTHELIDLVAQYLVARAYAETMRSEVDKIERQVLSEMNIISNEFEGVKGYGERITDPKLVYMASNDQWPAYHAECSRREREAGLKPTDMLEDNCPALVAEHDQLKIEWALLENSAKPLNVNWKNLHGENRQKWIDLVVGMVFAAERENIKPIAA